MEFGDSQNSLDTGDFWWPQSPNNQLGDPELYPENDDCNITTDSNYSYNSLDSEDISDSLQKETENDSIIPIDDDTCNQIFQTAGSIPVQRSIPTRHRLNLPKRIPPPPPQFKVNNPPFLPPPVHSDLYPFDSLNDAKMFIAHNNDKPANTWVCVPLNFINRFRNDRQHEIPIYGYLIKT